MKASRIRITIEIVAALTFLLLPLILVPVVTPFVTVSPLQPVLRGIVITHALVIMFYFWNFYFALPRLYFAGKKPLYGLVTVVIFTTIVLLLMSNPLHNPFPNPPFRYPNFVFFMSILLRLMMALFISFAIATYGRLRKAEELGLRSELSYLKAQINPHFLFNTLNSIYALAVSKSEKAPSAITRLASIMRYVIDETSVDLVPLEKELSYTAAYLELEKLRLNEKVKLSYEVRGEAAGKTIVPLILLPLIENAFKHGVSTNRDCEIMITILISEKDLKLHVKNSKVQGSRTLDGGLGLANVRKRLSLLSGKKNTLSIEENDQYFSASLQISIT